MKTRANLIGAVGLAVAVLSMLFVFYGYENTWKLWNIPTMTPHFADLRVITAGAQARALGIDPAIDNIGDPWHRKLNYPRIWQGLYSLGVDQEKTTVLGIGLIALFLLGICLLFRGVGNAALAGVMAALLSPATLLGIERANIDLLMFFLLAAALLLLKRRHLLSTTLVLASFVLKLFPIFGMLVLVRKGRKIFLVSVAAGLAFALAYVGFNYRDIQAVSEATPRSSSLSYGLNVLWMNVESYAPVGNVVKQLSYLLAFALLLLACTALRRRDFLPEEEEAPNLDAFRMGCALYLGTFLLGNNWDYRLLFLIFTVPQLLAWTNHASRSIALVARIALAASYLSLWYLLILRFAQTLPYGYLVGLALDETAHWTLFGCQLYLLVFSMPLWVRQQFGVGLQPVS